MNRAALSALLSFVLSLGLGYITIPFLRRLKLGQSIRDDGPKSHYVKAGTPTMGGVMFILPIVLVPLLLGKDSRLELIAASIATLGFGIIGFIDDFIIVHLKRSLGLKAREKLAGQILLAIIFSYLSYKFVGSSIIIPFTSLEWDLGYFYIPIITFVMVGTVNSVNLTDGLDGLASGITLIVATTIAAISLALGNGNLSLFAAAMAGGTLAFLRFNTHPALVFMGDTGSMALGGGLVALMVLLRQPLLLPIIGGIYMIESLSVILQVISFKTRGKRIFKMSPIHHHYELKGVSETRIVSMFMLATAVLCIIGLLAIRPL